MTILQIEKKAITNCFTARNCRSPKIDARKKIIEIMPISQCKFGGFRLFLNNFKHVFSVNSKVSRVSFQELRSHIK